MNRTSACVLATLLVSCLHTEALAASPESVVLGQQLFERNWTPRNPQLGGDGLGPLFNGQSCVACHHQGGVGGSGDARFNANTLGIEYMKITGGLIDNDVVTNSVRAFHPGFVSVKGTILNTLILSHHGGSQSFDSARTAIKSNIDGLFSSEGGPTDPGEVRRAFATPILFSEKVGRHQVTIRARLFQRNTTSMFGASLIDQISGKDIEAQVKLQKQHREISGRPSTLDSGRYGKFGWRGNVASLLEFVDQACAAECGLETARKQQPADPTMPEYRNPTVDISDEQIVAMRDFLAALPAPTREFSTSSEARAQVQRGEQLFASIGCAVCHVPDMGPAKGVYSDILLHDMGYESMDLNSAEPYIVRVTKESVVVAEDVSIRETGRGTATYYGGTTEMSIDQSRDSSNSSPRSPRSGRSFFRRLYEFSAPTQPTARSEVFKVGSERFSGRNVKEDVSAVEGFIGDFTVTTEGTFRRDKYIRLTYEPTNITQEWRTPPLWGLRDSAPYMHDGRAATVLESIVMHDGESAGTRDRFLQLPLADRRAVLAFLDTLVAPPNAPQLAR